MNLQQIDWLKLVGGGALVVAGWLAPRVYRAWKNLGKTEVDLALEDLDRAVARAKAVHSDGVEDERDIAADKSVDAARARLAAKKRLRSVLDAFADADKGE